MQLFESMGRLVTSEGEAQEKVMEVIEKLNVFEAGAKQLFPEGTSFTNGENLRLLAVSMSATSSSFKVHEVLGGEVLSAEKSPLLFSWITAWNNHPLVKDLIPPHDKPVRLVKFIIPSGPISSK